MSLVRPVEGEGLYTRCQKATARVLCAVRTHQIIIGLIFVDALLVIIDLSYYAVNPECHRPGESTHTPHWLEIPSHTSLAITSFFVLEIPLTIWALGLQWYNPFGRVTHAWLHLFDAVVVIATFILELVLRGQESEIATLLVLLRLWRIVKLVTGVTVEAGELKEKTAEEFKHTKEELKKTKAELVTSQEQVAELQRRLNALSPSGSPV